MKTTTKQMAMGVLFVALVAALLGDLIWLVYEPQMWQVVAWPILIVAIWLVANWLEAHDF